MRSHQDYYIHELTVDAILKILEKDAWKVGNQSITSAVTNTADSKEFEVKEMAKDQNTEGVYAFSDIKFDRGVKKILDIGGGKFDCNRNYLKRKHNIELLVWDPYNRSALHNNRVQAEVLEQKVDAVTSMSVLNVIPEVSVRLAHINTLKSALITGGKAYFKIWSGEYPLKGTYLPAATDTRYQANAYADRFLREIEIVFGIGNVRLDDKVPNLIVAVKLAESHTSRCEIAYIQKNSKKELALLTHIRDRSFRLIYARKNIYKLFSKNLSFLNKIENEFIKQNRCSNLKLQDEYDKKYGLVRYKSRM